MGLANKKRLVIACVIASVVVVVCGLVYWHNHIEQLSPQANVNATSTPSNISTSTTSSADSISFPPFDSSACLSSAEYADYPASEQNPYIAGEPNTSTIDIYVRNTQTNTEISHFQISDIDYQQAYALLMRPCNIYVIRRIPQPLSEEFWVYNYAGQGKQFIQLQVLEYSIDPTETYFITELNPAMASDTLDVFNLRTGNLMFVLPVSTINQNYPADAPSNFDSYGWTENDRYFWGGLFQQADQIAFFRIDTSNWTYQMFQAPDQTLGGDKLNLESGWVTYSINAAPWTGDPNADQYFQQQAEQNGTITSFAIYNLFTKQSYVIATSTDPTQEYNAAWIAPNQLQWSLPGGTSQIFTIPSSE